METLPKWFWLIHYILLILTLASGIVNWVRQRYSALAALTIILSLFVPIVSFVFGVGRTEGLNELEYVFAQMKTGDLWAIFIIVGYLYLLVWWYFFVSSYRSQGPGRKLGNIFHTFNAWLKRIIARSTRKQEKGREN